MAAEPDAIYGDLPQGWLLTSVAHLIEEDEADVQTGPFGTMLHASSYRETGTPVVAVRNIAENRLDHTEVPRVDSQTCTRLARYRLREGDILLGRKGAVERRALVHREEEGWLQGSDCIRVRMRGTRVHSRFVSFVLGTPQYRKWIVQNAHGATMPSLNQEIVGRIPLPLPPMAEQQAIACVLGALDDKIELNRRMNDTLEGIARAIFKSWFVDFDPVQAKRRGEPLCSSLAPHIADLFPDVFEASELGKIPRGWKVRTVNSLATINERSLGRTDPLNVIDYIEISKVMRGEISEIVRYERGAEPSRARRRPSHGDTVLSTVRPDRGAHFLCLNPPDTLIVSTGFAVLTPRNGCWAYLYSALTQPVVGANLGRLAHGGAYPAVRPDVIGSLRLISPRDQRIVNAFERIAQPLFEKAEHNRIESRTLAVLRDTLLPKLISGELRVPDAERIVGRCV
jgi:type I restriction enzyme S subunit